MVFSHAGYEGAFSNNSAWPPCHLVPGTRHPPPRLMWADELASADFLKWVKTKETHSSSGSDVSG